MSTTLEIIDTEDRKHNLTVTSLSRDDLPEDRTWLWKYESREAIDHDMVQGVILSSPSYEQANKLFAAHILKITPWYNVYKYAGSHWDARIEGEDYFPERDDPIVLTDFLHA